MLVNPAIIGLALCSFMVSVAAIYASVLGVQIIRQWNLKSGSQKQLILERKTYLVSTVLNYVMGCELFSLFLFITMADRIHTLFIGAMCAVGTLNANEFGYVTLIFKAMNFIFCGIWLTVNYLDNKGYDYPLIRFKYKLLLSITPLIVAETVWLLNYLIRLEPEIITSCCGTLFNEDAQTVAGELAHLPSYKTKIFFYACLIFTLGVGIYFYFMGKGAVILALLNTALFFISLASVISFISLYYYELPTHHCPFCLIQKEYHYIGYALYLSLFLAMIMGASLGVINRFKKFDSLKKITSVIQKRFCCISMAGYFIFGIIATYPIIFSDFILEGY
ncbi:hypothetical protein QUF75_20680 [Desulfococcaceae bacterium HSG7]|nr:hypothetical protein [Desulfococcaceae bacterium HSG7]